MTWFGSATGASGSFTALPAGDFTQTPALLFNGTTTGTLTLNESSGIHDVYAVFTNSIASVQSKTVTISSVPARPTVTLQPGNQVVNIGSNATFASDAIVDPVGTSQWQVSTNGGNTWTNIAGATGNTYSFVATAAMTGNKYRNVYTNSQGTADTQAATLSVLQVTITENPTLVTRNGVQGYITVGKGIPNLPTVTWAYTTNGGATYTPLSSASVQNTASGTTLTTFIPLSAIPNVGSYTIQATFTETP